MRYTLLIFTLLAVRFSYAQPGYITIPDSGFVNWLDTNGFSNCLNGNQLDTNCAEVLNAKTISLTQWPNSPMTSRTISSIEGIQYFKSLDTLDASYQLLHDLPPLPKSLRYLNISANYITNLQSPLPDSLTNLNCVGNEFVSLPDLPTSLNILDCSANKLSTLPSLPPSLKSLYCSFNPITQLPDLPAGLTVLYCSDDSLASLPVLPLGLVELDCNKNKLRQLPVLPDSLRHLECYKNQLNNLPALPSKLDYLYCCYNQLTTLPALPNQMTYLNCNENLLSSLPTLPDSLKTLGIDGNQFTTLSSLPAHLKYFYCFNNKLSSLPELPSTLVILSCFNNELTSLPKLPSTLTTLECHRNKLTSLPELPDSMFRISCGNNPDLHCLPKFKRVVDLNFDSLDVGCVLPYGKITNSTPDIDYFPLCSDSDPYSCLSVSSVIESESFKFSLFPNPSSDIVQISGDAIDRISITNSLGKIIVDLNPDFYDTTLEINQSGLYFVTITSGGQSVMKKLVLNR